MQDEWLNFVGINAFNEVDYSGFLGVGADERCVFFVNEGLQVTMQ